MLDWHCLQVTTIYPHHPLDMTTGLNQGAALRPGMNYSNMSFICLAVKTLAEILQNELFHSKILTALLNKNSKEFPHHEFALREKNCPAFLQPYSQIEL